MRKKSIDRESKKKRGSQRVRRNSIDQGVRKNSGGEGARSKSMNQGGSRIGGDEGVRQKDILRYWVKEHHTMHSIHHQSAFGHLPSYSEVSNLQSIIRVITMQTLQPCQ